MGDANRAFWTELRSAALPASREIRHKSRLVAAPTIITALFVICVSGPSPAGPYRSQVPAELGITDVNVGANPVAAIPFNVVATARTPNFSQQGAAVDTPVQLSVPAGAGTLGVPPPNFVSAVSRKVHGAAGTFDLPLSSALADPTTEPRIGPAQMIVFTFDKAVASTTVTVIEGTATAGAPTFSGNDVIVPLAGVTNAQYVTIALTDVASTDGGTGGTASVRVGFLLGDANQNRVISLADLGLVNAQLAQRVTAGNYLKDVNASGTLTLADKGVTNANLTNALPAPICDSGLASDSSDPLQYASALDLCQRTTELGTGPGLISAQLTLSSGAGVPASASHAIRGTFGTNNTPRAGAAMVVLSTGAAAAPGQTNPLFTSFQPGLDTETSSPAPADWLTANGGAFPVAPGCPSANGATAFNPVMLTLRIRVPGNAHSLKLSARFFSADYPEYVCSGFNDVFVALLDSVYAGTPSNPADKNLATYTSGALKYPLGVNLAHGNTGLFTQCVNGNTGCAGAVAGSTITCTSTAALVGTGMDTPDSQCSTATTIGGGTDWLVIRGNVVPNEIITLRLALWDTADGLSDSVVLLDNFAWSPDTVVPGVSLQ